MKETLAKVSVGVNRIGMASETMPSSTIKTGFPSHGEETSFFPALSPIGRQSTHGSDIGCVMFCPFQKTPETHLDIAYPRILW